MSAFASSLLSLDAKPAIHVVSSAPPHVFSECINQGAQYRNADVDPVIVQPLAFVFYFHFRSATLSFEQLQGGSAEKPRSSAGLSFPEGEKVGDRSRVAFI